VERFLRAAEPPGHDDWQTTATLKAEYKQGYAKALEQLKRRVSEELRALVVPRPRQGSAGPERLRKRFPIGRVGSAGSVPSLFHFSRLRAEFDGTRWHFSGLVQPAEPTGAWECAIRLFELGEDGSVANALPIQKLDSDEVSSLSLEEGIAHLAAEEGLRQVSFSGMSAVLPARAIGRGELRLEVEGRTR
jgi:hypothetical protein